MQRMNGFDLERRLILSLKALTLEGMERMLKLKGVIMDYDLNKKRAILITGKPGTGKSTKAKTFCKTLLSCSQFDRRRYWFSIKG